MNTADRLANRYFLVVDDEEFIRTLVTRFLKKAGAADVITASNGREALAAIRTYDMAFDAVITDINMRPTNGLELLSAIRTGAGGLKRNTPVLMLTAHAEAKFVAEALALDADAFVVKPVERDALIERVLRALARTVPIQAAARYAQVGIRTDDGVAAVVSVGPAPPTKPLRISLESVLAPSRGLAPPPPARRTDALGEPLAAVQKVALADVKVNSILAQDIHFADSPTTLLVAAPAILTEAMLARLRDLRYLHDSQSYVFVFEPRMQEA